MTSTSVDAHLCWTKSTEAKLGNVQRGSGKQFHNCRAEYSAAATQYIDVFCFTLKHTVIPHTYIASISTNTSSHTHTHKTVTVYTSHHVLVHLLSRRQTIDKVGQLLGRGLVSKDNRPMKCTTSKLLTCPVANGGPIWSAFMLFRSQKIKQQKRRRSYRLPFFVVTVMTWQVTRVMVQRFHQPIVLGNNHAD